MTQWSSNELESMHNSVASNELERMDQFHRQQELQHVSDQFLFQVGIDTNFQAAQDIQSEKKRRAENRMAESHGSSQDSLLDNNNLISDPFDINIESPIDTSLDISTSFESEWGSSESVEQYELPESIMSEELSLFLDQSCEQDINDMVSDINWSEVTTNSEKATNNDSSKSSPNGSKEGAALGAIVGGAFGSVGGPAGIVGGAAIGGLFGSLLE